MTLKASFVTIVVGATLVLGVPAAWGKAQPASAVSPDAVERAVQTRELSRYDVVVLQDAFDRVPSTQQQGSTIAHSSDAFERTIGGQQSRSGSAGLERPSDRGVGMNRQYGLGTFAGLPRDAFERGVATSGTGSVADRSIGLNRTYGLGEFASALMTDTHDRGVPVQAPASTPSAAGGLDVDWPQLGIGFGIGLLLATALMLAMRATRIRPLAH